MEWISKHFESGTLINGELVSKESAPIDIVLGVVLSFLRSDSMLESVFGGRIDAVPVLDPYDFGTMPRLRIAPFDREPTEAPSSMIINETVIFLEIRYEIAQVRSLDICQASIGTLVAYLEKVMRASGNRLLNVDVNGTNVPLASESHMRAVTFRADPDPRGTNRVAFGQVMEWVYSVKVDQETGKIQNVIAAGG
jgi:hypothetical protein